jgi:flagellar basal-body rod protein FlgG
MAIIALHSAASGMSALSTQLDVIANNIANTNNNGFKTSRVNFEDLLYQYQQTPGAKNNSGDTAPIGTGIGYGTRISGTELNMTQGSTIVTGGPLDMTIRGNGFFRVKTLSTQGDGLAYTRTGSFTTDADGNVVMANSDGYKLDPPITIPPGSTNISISQDGRVFYTAPGSTTPQGGSQIKLANFANPQGLIQIGGNLYQQSAASGEATQVNPGEQGTGTLQQGALESSNVDPVNELVNMIKTQRSFELNSQAIQAADQMLQQISNLRR